MVDLVIRNGQVYDGTGGAPFAADVAINDGKIVAVGSVTEKGKEEIDAQGKIVTPGFVDAHTHYDGQVTWDPYLSPSSYHGVTTVVTGNCGVGFAPCKRDRQDWLIGLMEGVEDIPGTALHEGIDWNWESFPEYLDALEQKPLAMDVGTQIPHGAIRAFVMGERGIEHEPAQPEEIAQMAALVKEGIEAGALGFTTSRTEKHQDVNGNYTPSLKAFKDELVGIAKAVGETGRGVLQGISDFYDFDGEFTLFREMVEASGRPISLTVEQQDHRPDYWKQLLDALEQAQKEGLPMRGQVPPRATGLLMGLNVSFTPFSFYPSFGALSMLSTEERLATLRDPAFKTKLLAEKPVETNNEMIDGIMNGFHKMFRLGEPANYEPDPKDSVAGLAERTGQSPQEIIYDMLLEQDGTALIYMPLFNYLPGSLEFVETMLEHPHTTFGLGDAGAHCGALCDASFPTTLIQHWGRDRTRGKKLPLEKLISMQTRETAELVQLYDRGVLKPGYKADVNIIDFDKLTLHHPTVEYDLPAGGRRLVQRASGYVASIISGKVAFREGIPTGELNGKLIRGTQLAPQEQG